MIGQWNPGEPAPLLPPQPQQLQTLAATAADLLQGKDDPDLLQRAAGWIKLSEAQWHEACSTLTDDELLAVAGFYVKAEMTLSGFESGAANPAIAIFRHLKQLGRLPGKDVIRALKAETANRYIPYGKVML